MQMAKIACELSGCSTPHREASQQGPGVAATPIGGLVIGARGIAGGGLRLAGRRAVVATSPGAMWIGKRTRGGHALQEMPGPVRRPLAALQEAGCGRAGCYAVVATSPGDWSIGEVKG